MLAMTFDGALDDSGVTGRIFSWLDLFLLVGGETTASLFGSLGTASFSVRPRIFKLSADFRKELRDSWATLTWPLYMNWSREETSSYLRSLMMMIGCWHGLACKHENILNKENMIGS